MLLVLTSLLSGCSEIAKRHAAQQYLKATIIPGIGLGDIHIRTTTLEMVVDRLGRNYERKVHGEGYSPEDCEIIECPIPEPSSSTVVLTYKAQGLIFLFGRKAGQTTPEAELVLDSITVECIHKRCPFEGKTEQGLRLGDTREQVKEVYGRPRRANTNTWLMSYPKKGISFLIDHPYNDPIKETDRVKGITIPDRD